MSLQICEGVLMAKSRMGRPPKGRNDVSVKLDAISASRARFVAKARGQTLVEYLSETFGPIIERDFKKEGEKLKG